MIMKLMSHWLTLLTLLSSSRDSKQIRQPKVLLVMLDGFGQVSLNRNLKNMMNLRRMYEEGVKAESGVIPVFPTLTTANIFALETGLYPKDFMDFHGSDELLPHYCEMNANCNRSICTDSDGKSRFRLFSRRSEKTWIEKVDEAIERLKESELFVSIYFDEFLLAYVKYGLNASEVVNKIDNMIGYLNYKTSDLNDVNLILLSSHGLTSISSRKLIEINRIIPSTAFASYRTLGMWIVRPKFDRQYDILYSRLVDSSVDLNFSVAHSDQYFERMNNRKKCILLIADFGYGLVDHKIPHDDDDVVGDGYIGTTESSTRGIFVANGPDFTTYRSVKAVNLVDLFLLLCRLLKLDPSRNNASVDQLNQALFPVTIKHIRTWERSGFGTWSLTASAVGNVFLVFAMASLFICTYVKRRKLKCDYTRVNTRGDDSQSDNAEQKN
ncbi:Uncharacterised protein r2_g3504 [Pycnogonum litorale]